MKEIISSILDAEARAEEIVKLAQEKSKALLLEAETKAEEIKEKALADFKERKKAIMKGAEVEAQKKYDERIAKGEKSVKELKEQSQDKIEVVVENILKDVLR